MTTRDRWLETSIKITILLALFMTAFSKADDGTRDLEQMVQIQITQLAQDREILQNAIQDYEKKKDLISKLPFLKVSVVNEAQAEADIKMGEIQNAIDLIEKEMRKLKTMKVGAK